MADSSSLALLPARTNTSASQENSVSRSSQSEVVSGDESFKNKLEKAKELKERNAVKKPTAHISAKPATTKTAAPSPSAETDAGEKFAAPTDQAKKSEKPVTDAADGSAADEETAQLKLPKAQDVPVDESAVEHLTNKKSSKASKSTAGKNSTPGVAGPKLSAVIQAPPDQSSKPDVNAIHRVGADDGNGEGEDTDVANASVVKAGTPMEFGTGKVITNTKGEARGSSSDDSSADANSPDATAAASAASIAVPGFVHTATKLDAPEVKSAHPDTPLADISSAASGLLTSPSASPAAHIAGKTTPVVTPQARFVEDNQPKIISSIQGQLMPRGGTMQLRLDPPELGALSVTVHMRDGVMTASFETSNADATKMLSHSLGQLKAGLEAAGISVDKIHVEQGKHDSQGDANGDGKSPMQEQQRQGQQDQQRREMVQRMWRKLAGGDPLDLVA